MSSPNIVFWDSYTRTWRARMEFDLDQIEWLLDQIPYGDGTRAEFQYLIDEIQRHNREREDFDAQN